MTTNVQTSDVEDTYGLSNRAVNRLKQWFPEVSLSKYIILCFQDIY